MRLAMMDTDEGFVRVNPNYIVSVKEDKGDKTKVYLSTGQVLTVHGKAIDVKDIINEALNYNPQ